MWNVIRGPPYAGRDEIFAKGFSQQFVAESQSVGILYALIAIAFTGLITRVPAAQNENVQRFTAYFFLMAFLGLLSVLVSVFKIKNGGYPFRLLW